MSYFHHGSALCADSYRQAISAGTRAGIQSVLIWLRKLNWLWMHLCVCVERAEDFNYASFCALCSEIRNNAVLIHKALWIPRDCAEVVNNWWQATAVQRASYESVQSCCSVFRVLLVFPLKNADTGLHLLSLSSLYTAAVYEWYFRSIVASVYSQSYLLLECSIKMNK